MTIIDLILIIVFLIAFMIFIYKLNQFNKEK